MSQAVKFLFETEFREEARREAEPRMRVVDHEAMLAAARAEAFEAGRAAGRREAIESAERARADAVDRMAGALHGAAADLSGVSAHLERQTLEVAVSVGKALAEALVAREPLEEVRRLVADCLANLTDAPHLVVRVHDDLLDEASATLNRLAGERGFAGRLVVLAEPTIARGDCRIEWASGGVVLDRDEVRRRVDETVARHLSARATPSLARTP